MGLWDILVPSEAGVLHNLIANPSFEYDNNEIDVARLRAPSGGSNVAEIASFRTLPANTGITYWNELKGSTVSRSSAWASRGGYSLKINAGTSTNGGAVYDPRLSSPSLANVGVSVTVANNASDNIPAQWNKIPSSSQFHVAVFGLTDTGMALANGISDSQFFYNPNDDDIVAYPTMDAKRGHTAPIFASLTSITPVNSLCSIKVIISGGQDLYLNSTIRGWAVWYSMDTTATKTYTLASIVPASADAGTSTTVFIHTVINKINSANPATPLLCTGKIYMYPFAVDGEYIVKGIGTSFLTELSNGTDLYVDSPSDGKQFLGRVDLDGFVYAAIQSGTNNTISATQNSNIVAVSGSPSASALVGRRLYTSSGVLIGTVASSSGNNVTLSASSSITYAGTYIYSNANQITFTQGSTSVTVSGTPSADFLVGRLLSTMSGQRIGIVVSASGNVATLESGALVGPTTGFASENYRYSVATQTQIRLRQPATTTPINSAFYRVDSTNVQAYPDNPVGAISAFRCNPSTGQDAFPLSIGVDCASPYFGITNNTFANNTYKHHFYLDWYLSSPNLVNPNATYADTGAQWKVSLINIVADTVSITSANIQRGSTSGTVTDATGFAVGDCIYTTSNEFVAEIISIQGTNLTFLESARYTISNQLAKRLPITAGTVLGTLDASTATQLNAKRMGLRTKFLITPPSGDTSRMQLRFQYTGTLSDADLFIDGVQFVDSGMIWRSYDYYSSSMSSYVNPPQFSDWDWDDIEFSYVDGDTPGAIWSDTMPTQSGTYSATFPYFTNDGVWHADFDEYDTAYESGVGNTCVSTLNSTSVTITGTPTATSLIGAKLYTAQNVFIGTVSSASGSIATLSAVSPITYTGTYLYTYSPQSGHGMGTPRFRQQYQWRNEARPVYGVSVPGLAQSSLLTPTFNTGFWASLDTDNINVVVEPTISGTGMPEVATTALEYGITDGGFVQRQVARMRNMQFNVTISAKSWVGLHANRRSLINLLKFDQLAQQGERMLRYTGADTPITTRITYVGGLEFSGVQTQSFTEVLGLRFISADPYFYTETPFTQDISPSSVVNEASTVFYKLGNTSEWTPLNFRSNEMVLTSDELLTNSASTPQLQSKNIFWDFSFAPSVPKAIGWLQSPSGNVSTLVVGGNFSYPFSTIAFFYVSGFTPDTQEPNSKVSFNTGIGTLTVALGATTVNFSDPETFAGNSSYINKFLFVGGDYVGRIISINSTTQCTIDAPAPTAHTAQPFQFVTLSNVNIDAPPAQVYGKQLFQLTGGDAVSNASVNAIYQESANSIIVVGDFYQVIDFGDRTPNTNLNTSDYFVTSGKVSTTVRFGDNNLSTQYPYYRIARFVMNDNGRVVAYPIDSQFEYDESSGTFRSMLFNQIANQSLNAITQSPSGYIFVGGNVNTSVLPLDNTLTNTFAPAPAYRGPSAFARTSSQSNVYTINPNIVSQNNINSLEYAGFIGYRLGVSRAGWLSTNPQGYLGSHLVTVSDAVSGSDRTPAQPFTRADIGKIIFTDVGVYIGQIYALPGNASSSNSAILAQPAQVRVSNSGFSVLGDIKSLTTDKKSSNSTVFAVVDSKDETQAVDRASLYAYVPSPKNVGKMSFVDGSLSVAIVGQTFKNSLGLDNTGKIQCSIDSNIVVGDETNFNTNMIGNFLIASDGTYIGQVLSIQDKYKLTLTTNAFTNVGVVVTNVDLSVKGTVRVVTTVVGGQITATSTIETATTAGAYPTFTADIVGQFFYLSYPLNVPKKLPLATLCGQVLSYQNAVKSGSKITPGKVTLTTNSKSVVNTNWTNKQSKLTNWFVKDTDQIYESFSVVSNKNFTDSDGYLLRAGQVQTIVNESDALPSGIARLRTPSPYTSSTTQFLGTNYNAYAMYTSKGSDTAIVNFDSLESNRILNSIVRRQFDASSSVKALAYDPVVSSDAVTGFSEAFASYSFGTIAPVFPTAGTSGTLTVTSTSISGDASISGNNHFYATVNNRIVYFGLTSSLNTLTTNYFGNVNQISSTWWSLPNNGSVFPDANSTKLVKGIGTIKSSGSGFSGTNGATFTAFDVGRSVYTYISASNTWQFICIITAVSSGTIITTTTKQYDWSADIDYYLSGGAPVSSNNNVAWYPYQFAFSQGNTSGFEYLSSTAYGIEASTSVKASVSNTGVATVTINSQSGRTSNVPAGLASATYDLYGYFQGVDISNPNVVGMWYLLGSISGTTSTTISLGAYSPGVVRLTTTVNSSLATLLNVVTSPTESETLNAFKLIGYNLYSSNGTYIGRVDTAPSATQVRLQGNAAVVGANQQFYYFPEFPSNGQVGTPLSIVRRTRIQTAVPSSYKANDELYTYSFVDTTPNATPILQYLGTIQQIIQTGTAFVDVSYMPYWATPKTLIDSSNTYISGLTSDLYGQVTTNTYGSATVLRATKSLKASVFANYFADVVGIVSSVTPNQYNTSQTATIGWDIAADAFDSTLPDISQVEPISDFSINVASGTSILTANASAIKTTTLPNTIAVSNGSSSYSITGTPASIISSAVFRYDGAYIGSTASSGTTFQTGTSFANTSGTQLPYSYTTYVSTRTITTVAGSHVATVSNVDVVSSIVGKAIFTGTNSGNVSAGTFLGVVRFINTSSLSIYFDSPCPVSVSGLSYWTTHNATKQNTINISSLTTGAHVVLGLPSKFTSSGFTYETTFVNVGLFKFLSSTNPSSMYIGLVSTSTTQNPSNGNQNITFLNNARTTTNGHEPFWYMTRPVNTVNISTNSSSTNGTTNLSPASNYLNANDAIFHGDTGVFIGIVASRSTTSSSFTLVSNANITADSYRFVTATATLSTSVAVTDASTSSNLVAVSGSVSNLSPFINHVILIDDSSASPYASYLGVVKDYTTINGVKYLILTENSQKTVTNGNFRMIYAPSTLPIQVATNNTQSTDTINRISTTAGSNVVTVYGQPDAYTLAGNNATLLSIDNQTIGTVSGANSPTEAVISGQGASISYSGTYKYQSLQSISPVATITNGPASIFGANTAYWRTNGQYMGISGSVISTNPSANTGTFNFSHMPYNNTNGTSEYFIWANGTTGNSMHVLSYGSGASNTITIALGATIGSYVGDDLINVGYALYNDTTAYIGKVSSVDAPNNTFTLIEPAQVNVNNTSYYYSPNSHLVVFNGSPTAGDNEGRLLWLTNTSKSEIIDSSVGTVGIMQSPEFLGQKFGQTNANGNSGVFTYTYYDPRLKYAIIPGDVIRKQDAGVFSITNNDIIGQVRGFNIVGQASTEILTVSNYNSSLSNQNIRLHRKQSLSVFIGLMQGSIYQQVTIGGLGGTKAYIYGTGTKFTMIPVDFLNKENMNGTGFYVKTDTANSWSKVGVIYQVLSDTLMIVTLSATAISDFSGTLLSGGYSVQSMPGLGTITISQTGIMRSSGTATVLAEQLYLGCVVTIYNPDTSPMQTEGQYRVIDIFSNFVVQIANIDGSPYTGGLKTNRFFNVVYVYDEYPLLDTGLTTYTNQDWQPMGLTDGPINDVTTTQNGSIIISGNFTSWVDASYIGTTSRYNNVKKDVGRVAKITPLIADGRLFDAYASPIVGSSYTNNGFNGSVNLVRDITDINPINGYVGSGDRLMIAGTFTGSRNGESVSHGVAYAEGSTISGNLQTIVNADVIFPVYRNSTNVIRSQTLAIASTNRLRKYYVNPITNILDGISGSNIAIIHQGFIDNSVNISSIESRMEYFSLRIRGNASVYPIIRIRNGGINRIIYELHQTETGARIRFDSRGLNVLAYEEITINFIPGQRSITSNIRGNMISFISPTSNFVDWILLGANNSAGKYTQSYDDYRINVIGIHAQAGMNVTISYTPRFWSFDANNMFFGTTKAGL